MGLKNGTYAFSLALLMLCIQGATAADVTVTVTSGQVKQAYALVGDKAKIVCPGSEALAPVDCFGTSGGYYVGQKRVAAGVAVKVGTTEAKAASAQNSATLTLAANMAGSTLGCYCADGDSAGFVTVLPACTDEKNKVCSAKAECETITCTKEKVCTAAEPDESGGFSRGATVSVIALTAAIAAIATNWFHFFLI